MPVKKEELIRYVFPFLNSVGSKTLRLLSLDVKRAGGNRALRRWISGQRRILVVSL
jgi:hypothetical protein